MPVLKGKHIRQRLADTEINKKTLDNHRMRPESAGLIVTVGTDCEHVNNDTGNLRERFSPTQ